MARKWSARSLRNLQGIHPDLRRVMDRALHESPLDFIVIEGLRTEERQRDLVASGASMTMNSRHLTGHAVDILPIGPDGKAAFAWPLYYKIAPAIKTIAAQELVALEWGGDWESFKDGPHFQLAREEYPAEAPFDPATVPATTRATAEARQNATGIGAALTGAASAVGSVVAASQDAPLPLQYALAAAIVIVVAGLVYRTWGSEG